MSTTHTLVVNRPPHRVTVDHWHCRKRQETVLGR